MQLYAVPWYNCNLSCPHCHVKNRKVEQNYNKFFNTLLQNSDNYFVTLFGGEPTLYYPKFEQIISNCNVDSVSTNLVALTPEDTQNLLAPLLYQHDVDVATSWNDKRFKNESQEKLWFNNVKILCNENVDVLVLITLTQSLLEGEIRDVLHKLDMMEGVGVSKFLFEPYIGSNECNKLADEWLCKFHDMYKGNMWNLLAHRMMTGYNCNCDDIFTLEPDGKIRRGCPDSLITTPTFCDECMTCKRNMECRPCKLQKTCSFPKEYARRLGIK